MSWLWLGSRIRRESCLCFCLYTNLILSHLRSHPILTHTHTDLVHTKHTINTRGLCVHWKRAQNKWSRSNDNWPLLFMHFCVPPRIRAHHFISPFRLAFQPNIIKFIAIFTLWCVYKHIGRMMSNWLNRMLTVWNRDSHRFLSIECLFKSIHVIRLNDFNRDTMRIHSYIVRFRRLDLFPTRCFSHSTIAFNY